MVSSIVRQLWFGVRGFGTLSGLLDLTPLILTRMVNSFSRGRKRYKGLEPKCT